MLEGILGPAPTGSNLQLTDTPFRNVHLACVLSLVQAARRCGGWLVTGRGHRVILRTSKK
jgi:hypothetical protein